MAVSPRPRRGLAGIRDTLDAPPRAGLTRKDGGTENGHLTKSIGFRSYAHAASKDGFVRIALATVLVNGTDNGGKAWRPDRRVLRQDGKAEAWSSNGKQIEPSTGRATMFFRVTRGDELTVIASIALANDRHGPAAAADCTLGAKQSK